MPIHHDNPAYFEFYLGDNNMETKMKNGVDMMNPANYERIVNDPATYFNNWDKFNKWKMEMQDIMERGVKDPNQKGKRICIAYPAFLGSVRDIYPEVKVIERWQDVKKFDLVIFSGGEDINPRIYNEENTYSSYNSRRDDIELNILNYALDSSRVKILTFCRGHQLLNAKLGGKLWQDYHMEGNFPIHPGNHTLTFAKGSENSVIYRFFNGKQVVSCHHQSVKKVGEGLKDIASFMGVNEAVENDRMISVQFHPEFDIEPNRAFFQFINEEW